MQYVAESVPAYMVERAGHSEAVRDIDAAMSGPTTHGVCATQDEARKILAQEIESYAQYRDVQRSRESSMYMVGALAIRVGVGAVKIGTHYYRVREA